MDTDAVEMIARCAAHQDVAGVAVEIPAMQNESDRRDWLYIAERQVLQQSLPEPEVAL